MSNTEHSSLAQRLRERIKREGPISFRDWMEAALYDPQDGYYCRRDLTRWGRTGDYRTSPERSPLFAATFAHFFATLYEELGAPRTWTIVEAGTGTGHFASGVLETLQRDYPEVFAATRYLIDEASADARKRARARLVPYGECVEYSRLHELATPISEGLIFSNELFDAFPVHRVIMRDGQLFELYVGVADTGAFCCLEREPTTPRLAAYLDHVQIHLAEGQIAEVNLEIEGWLARAAAILRRGYLITVDYGAEADELYGAPHRREGTLRAFHRHLLSPDALARPGEQDLTTTVDWTHIREIGERLGLRTISFGKQNDFLLRAGFLHQLERATAQAQSELEELLLRTSAREMILPGGMSESFQVLVQKRLSGY